jgi:hypothetical protein
MSESVRVSNLFAGEDYQFIFQAYSFIDYTAYDFDTLKQALINYIQTYYPEDFNDYVESSEFIAIIELIAYLGTSLAFRSDLNSRENFIDTAERRESIIRLARMVNYVPSRNIAANGLFKFSAVSTTQPTLDTSGNQISNTQIFWNDPNNPDWFDQFIQVLNQAFNPTNPFGRPSLSGVVGSIPTDLYTLNNVLKQNITYPVNITINGQTFPIDIVNPTFNSLSFSELPPDPNNAMNFIYQNDSLGVSSNNTGFFFYFKQGSLFNIDTNFAFPEPNRLFPVSNQNINNTDVYVQETDDQGNVLTQWVQVPQLAGQNIIYNSIQYGQRNIFDVISGVNDTVTIQFPDGNFGNVPTGLFRFWLRTSANQYVTIRPENAQGLQITIPYFGADNQTYNLTITFNLEYTVSNGAPSETNDQIRQRAPAIFSTQDRMVNGADYNTLPLIYGNQIDKLQAINRTYSGQSRYIDPTDPTGFHRDLLIFGQDGALYRDNQELLSTVVEDGSNTGNIDLLVFNQIQNQLQDPNLLTFFTDEYLPQFESKVRVNPSPTAPTGYSLLDLTNPNNGLPIFWKTSPNKFRNTTGYFIDTVGNPVLLASSSNFQSWSFIKTGSTVTFANSSLIGGVWTPDYTTLVTAPVVSVIQNGEPLSPSVSNIGPVELGIEVQNLNEAITVYPVFRTELNSAEITAVTNAINNNVSFWLYYDLINDAWGVSTTVISGSASSLNSQPFVYPAPPPGSIYSTFATNPYSWLLYVQINASSQTGTTTFSITTRGRVFIFESYRDVRFYWEPNQVVIDNSTGLALQDTIEIMPYVNTNYLVDNNNPGSVNSNLIPGVPNDQKNFLEVPVNFNISGIFTQDDGYQDNSKVQVSLVDSNGDNTPDDPEGFDRIVSLTDRIVFEFYSDEITGYEASRPWLAKWGQTFSETTTPLYLHFPVNPDDPTQLYGPPFISDSPTYANPLVPSSFTGNILYMDQVDLLFVNNDTQLEFVTNLYPVTIANQLTAFFNGPTPADLTAYPWLANTQLVQNKQSILNTYFLNLSYLIYTDGNGTVYPPGYGVYKSLSFSPTSDINFYPTGQTIIAQNDTKHYDKNGKVFTQNENVPVMNQQPLYFKWSHYSPIDQRVDPAPSNIIDMIVLVDSYYQDVLVWKSQNGSLSTMPIPPTTEELRTNFSTLDDYKMVSDAIVWNSGSFKLLFGTQAASELQANFLVVKSPTTTVSDNEVKTMVIQAIDTYFDIRNWDFGETFYYTELGAFIHQQLIRVISSVVIVPTNSNASFGDLFEIISAPNELFLSTATVNNVTIVANLTEQNLRI